MTQRTTESEKKRSEDQLQVHSLVQVKKEIDTIPKDEKAQRPMQLLKGIKPEPSALESTARLIETQRPTHASRTFYLFFYNMESSSSYHPESYKPKKTLLLGIDMERKMDAVRQFPGALPYTLTRENVDKHLYDPELEYVCSPKSDGERMMMIVTDGRAFLVNRRDQWREWVGLPARVLEDLQTTILDVEMIRFTDEQTGATSWDMQVFDVAMLRGKSVCDGLYQERLQHWMNMLCTGCTWLSQHARHGSTICRHSLPRY